jgi:hypothetical protein
MIGTTNIHELREYLQVRDGPSCYIDLRDDFLNLEIRVSSSEKQIRQMLAAWKEQVFVGGWKEVAPEGE